MKAITLSEGQTTLSMYALQQIPNEKARRHFLALTAKSIGYGGVSAVAAAFGVSRSMIHRGLTEIATEGPFASGRQRKEGAGRPTFKDHFRKHMVTELANQPTRYVRMPEPSDDMNGNKQHPTCGQPTGTQTEFIQQTIPASKVSEDAEHHKVGKKQRKLDIDRIVKEHSSYLKSNLDCIILPKDPYSIESWVEHIVEEQFAAIYGDPASHHMYVNLTLNEIKERLEDRTRIQIGKTTLWTIMRDMGFSLHKNMKYEQVGEQHPQRDEQFVYIQSLLNDYKMHGDIVLSMDAKAAVKLGCFLANGRVWCPQNQAPPVKDHDYAFYFKEIYPNGTDLVPAHLMDHRAIVKPFGVYDVVHNRAHVTIGISHDTSEFAGYALLKSWEKFIDTYQNAKRILILCDGGGSNRSTGFLWKAEVAKLHKLSKLPVMVCHYPPGCSKYDPIEHRVWSMVSKNWQGSPLLDIERVMYFIQSTRTKTGLEVTCELDTNEYLTQTQKKEAGISLPSKEEIFKEIKITNPNPNGALANWNYLIGS